MIEDSDPLFYCHLPYTQHSEKTEQRVDKRLHQELCGAKDCNQLQRDDQVATSRGVNQVATRRGANQVATSKPLVEEPII